MTPKKSRTSEKSARPSGSKKNSRAKKAPKADSKRMSAHTSARVDNRPHAPVTPIEPPILPIPTATFIF